MFVCMFALLFQCALACLVACFLAGVLGSRLLICLVFFVPTRDTGQKANGSAITNVNDVIHKENMAKANPPPTIDDEFSRGSTGPVMILEVQWEGKYIKLFII